VAELGRFAAITLEPFKTSKLLTEETRVLIGRSLPSSRSTRRTFMDRLSASLERQRDIQKLREDLDRLKSPAGGH